LHIYIYKTFLSIQARAMFYIRKFLIHLFIVPIPPIWSSFDESF
jgi:hypothetical protein